MISAAEAVRDPVLPAMADDDDQVIPERVSAAGAAADRLGRIVRGRRKALLPGWPLDDPWNDVLGQKDAVVHHIAFRVPDIPHLQATTAFLQAKGGKWTEGSMTTVYSYVDMRPQLGFVIEAIAAMGQQPPPVK